VNTGRPGVKKIEGKAIAPVKNATGIQTNRASLVVPIWESSARQTAATNIPPMTNTRRDAATTTTMPSKPTTFTRGSSCCSAPPPLAGFIRGVVVFRGFDEARDGTFDEPYPPAVRARLAKIESSGMT
jgi:hypothetical protein